MLRVISGMAIMAILYAAFAVLYRDKRCGGNCGACSGTCQATGEPYDSD
jgi:hypothetical protein